MKKASVTPGRDGLPKKKAEYSQEEKALIVSKVAEAGIHVVAEAYGVTWQKISAWKKTCGNVPVKTVTTTTVKKIDVKPQAKPEVKPEAKTQLIIQSPSGMEITPEEILKKLTDAGVKDGKAYVRADEGKAYWVCGEDDNEEHGAVDLW